LFLKLKFKGENSKEFQHFKKSMELLNMNKPPPGINQKHIVQNILKFTKPTEENFENFRFLQSFMGTHNSEKQF
jgi:hypothetical protein